MLRYVPGDTPAHALDPRTKLALQGGFVAAAFAHTTPVGLAALTPLALAASLAAGLSPVRALWAYRYALVLLAVGPAVVAVELRPPGLALGEAWATALASYRVVLILLVAGAYVRSTATRESRAAVQHTVPGRAGTLLGVGVGLVFRLFPTLLSDVRTARQAMRARLGRERPLAERMRIVAVRGLARALRRADRLAVAMSARCFAWNPTLPALSFGRRDYAGLVVAAGLFAVAAAGAVGVDTVTGVAAVAEATRLARSVAAG
ncbi:MAG: energy-coupling factor transporter transmembrane protein EcfT [Halolamina sp.]